MKKLITAIILWLIAGISIAETSRIVAIVNGTPITFYDFQMRKNMVLALSNIENPDAKTVAQINSTVMNLLIEEELLFQHANKVNAKITDLEIDEAINNIAQRNKISIQDLYKFLSSKNVDRNIFRAQIKAELVKMNILSSLTRTVTVTPNEIDAAILRSNKKDTKISAYIFTSKDKGDSTLKKMHHLQKSLRDCDSFSESAYAKFATKTTIEGYLKSLDHRLQTIIKDLHINQVSSVFDANDGFQLVLVCDKVIENVSSEENEYVTNFLTNKKMSQKAQKFFEDLRKKAYIKVMLNNNG